MVSVFVHGRRTQAVHLICDPFPGTATGPTVLRVRWKLADVAPFDGSLAPIIFECGGCFYEGIFRQVARIDEPPDEIVCTLISEGPIEETDGSFWSRPLRRLTKWWDGFEVRRRTTRND